MALRRSLKRVSDKFLRKAEVKGPEDNTVVRFSGVSLRFLNQLKEDILEKKVADAVEIYILSDDVTVLAEGNVSVQLTRGATVRIISRYDDNSCMCHVRYVGGFKLKDDSVLIEKPRSQWTIEDVCEYFVLDETREERAFFLDCMNPEDVGERFQGAFLSQARKSCYSDLIDSLLLYYKGKDIRKQYLWFDVFCANQSLLNCSDGDELPLEVQQTQMNLLKYGLHEAINCFDDRLIYFNSWANPYPIQRAWCVWEIFGCVKTRKRLEILFRPNEEEDFVDILTKDKEEVINGIRELNLENAQCFVESDKRGIDNAVEEQIEGGYHTLNVEISKLVQQRLKSFAELVVKKKRKERGSERSIAFAESLSSIATFFREQMGLYDEAMSLLQESLKIRMRTEKTDNRGIALVFTSMGTVFLSKGDFQSALEMFEKALEAYVEFHGGRENKDVAVLLHNTAGVLFSTGRYDEALKMYEEALTLEEKVFGGRENAIAACTLHNIALTLVEKGEYESALEINEEVIRIREKIFGGRDHPVTVGTLHNIAWISDRMGDNDKALELYEEILHIKEKLYGGRSHPEVVLTLSNMAHVLQKKGEYDRALKLHEEVLKARIDLFGSRNHQDVATTLNNIALVLLDKEEYDKALEMFEDILQLRIKIFSGKDHPDVATTLENMGTVFYRKGEFEKALEFFQEALEMRKRIFGEIDHPLILSTFRQIEDTT